LSGAVVRFRDMFSPFCSATISTQQTRNHTRTVTSNVEQTEGGGGREKKTDVPIMMSAKELPLPQGA
jgi:hypothetical protein